MTRRVFLASLAAVMTAGMPLCGHDSYRIVGIITKLDEWEISVRNKDRKTFVIALRKDTYVRRDKKKVPVTELRVGLHVVVSALGDNEQELEAQDVIIVPEP